MMQRHVCRISSKPDITYAHYCIIQVTILTASALKLTVDTIAGEVYIVKVTSADGEFDSYKQAEAKFSLNASCSTGECEQISCIF